MVCPDIPSRTILGTAQFEPTYGFDVNKGQLSTDGIATELFDAAWEKGVQEIDTALAYGNAHQIIENYLIKNTTKYFNITTKFREKDAKEVEIVEKLISLQNCAGVEVLLHREMDLDNLDAISFVRRFSEKFHKAKWGVSVYQIGPAEKALKFNDCRVIQIPLSMFNQDFVQNDFIERAQKKGVKVVARSVYSLGLVFQPIDFFNSFPSAVKDAIVAIHEFSHSQEVSIASIACSFAQWAGADKWIVGVNSVSQFNDVFNSLSNGKLDELFEYISQQSQCWDSDLFRPELWDENFRKNLIIGN